MSSENPDDQKNATPNAKNESDNHATQTKPVVSPAIGSAKPETPPPPEKCKHSHCGEKHWLDYLEAGMGGIGLLVLVIYTIATIVYACITNNMWEEMRTQTRNQWETKVNAERPWVVVSEIFVADDLTYTDGGTKANFTLGYVLNNAGHSPAFVKIYGMIVDGGGNVKKDLKAFCEGWETRVNKNWVSTLDELPYIAIPAIRATYYIPDESSVQPLLIHKEKVKEGYFQPYSIGCVFYRSVIAKADEVPKETRFYGEITLVGRKGSPPPAYKSKGIKLVEGTTKIPMESLRVINVFPTQVAN